MSPKHHQTHVYNIYTSSARALPQGSNAPAALPTAIKGGVLDVAVLYSRRDNVTAENVTRDHTLLE